MIFKQRMFVHPLNKRQISISTFFERESFISMIALFVSYLSKKIRPEGMRNAEV